MHHNKKTIKELFKLWDEKVFGGAVRGQQSEDKSLDAELEELDAEAEEDAEEG